MGTFADLYALYTQAREGDVKAGRGFNLILGNTPFLNLWYARAGLDYLVVNSLREAVSPGYLRRRDRTLLKEYGQRQLLPGRAF